MATTQEEFIRRAQVSPESPMIEFQTLDEYDAGDSTISMWFGPAGVGKTRALATAGTRTLLVNIGDGVVSLKSKPIRDRFYKDGPPLIVTIIEERDPVSGLFKAADAFDKTCDAIDLAIKLHGDRFDTIAVDDATKLRAFAMNKGLELNAEFQRSKTLEKGKRFGGFVAGVQDFGAEMDFVEKFIDGTKDICKQSKKHFILTAHERHIYKKLRDNTGKVIGEEIDKIKPGFTGKTMPDEITQYFDMIWHFGVSSTGQGQVFTVRTQPSMGITAKTRYEGTNKDYKGLFPDVMKSTTEPFNFLNVVAQIRAAVSTTK